MSNTDVHTVIRGGRILHINEHVAPLADILIHDQRIVEIGPPGFAAPEGCKALDATDRLLIPGLVNAHTHGHGAIGKGLGDRWTLELLLNAGPWLNGGRTLRHKYLSTVTGALEMLQKGCTSCYDLYFEFPAPSVDGLEAVAQGYLDAGMRAVVAPMIADQTFFEAIPGLMEALPETLRQQMSSISLGDADATLTACENLLRTWRYDRDRIRPALAPTIPLHCTDEFIARCRDLADEYDVGVHMHLAESKVQAIAGMKRYGKTLAAHLEDVGLLGPRFTGAHCVWLDDDDIKRMADLGASIAHNPGSNLRLGSGIAAAREMLQCGMTLGIGTDGAQCSDNQNVFEAMRFASFVSRVRDHDPALWLATEQVLSAATAGGSEALGFGDDLGRLESGALADIVFLDLTHINYWPLNDPTNQIVHTEDGSAVHSVMVGGDLVLEDGRFTKVDMQALRAEVAEAGETLVVENAAQRAFAEHLGHTVNRFCVGLCQHPYHAHRMATAPLP